MFYVKCLNKKHFKHFFVRFKEKIVFYEVHSLIGYVLLYFITYEFIVSHQICLNPTPKNHIV